MIAACPANHTAGIILVAGRLAALYLNILELGVAKGSRSNDTADGALAGKAGIFHDQVMNICVLHHAEEAQAKVIVIYHFLFIIFSILFLVHRMQLT